MVVCVRSARARPLMIIHDQLLCVYLNCAHAQFGSGNTVFETVQFSPSGEGDPDRPSSTVVIKSGETVITNGQSDLGTVVAVLGPRTRLQRKFLAIVLQVDQVDTAAGAGHRACTGKLKEVPLTKSGGSTLLRGISVQATKRPASRDQRPPSYDELTSCICDIAGTSGPRQLQPAAAATATR